MRLVSILLAVLASNGSGKTLVRQSPGTVVPFIGYSGPLMADDPNTVCHAYFDGIAIRDTKGCAWAQQGTVPQTQKNGKTPPGAGVFSDTNHYTFDPNANGNDPLDFSGDFTICAIGTGAATATRVVVVNGDGANAGYSIQTDASRKCRIIKWPGANSADTANVAAAGELFACCVGRGDGKVRAKLNLGTLAETTTAVQTVGTSSIARLGRWNSAGYPWDGLIYEVWFTTTPASDALFTSVQQRIKLRAGITAW